MVLARAPHTLAMPTGGTQSISTVSVGIAFRESRLELTCDSRPGAEHAGHARGGTQSGSAKSVGIALWNRFLMNLAAVFVFIETFCSSFFGQ